MLFFVIFKKINTVSTKILSITTVFNIDDDKKSLMSTKSAY